MRLRQYVGYTGLIAACGFWGAAQAQVDSSSSTAPAATPGNNTGLEEVVVTAQRREERIQNTPISMAALTGDTLVERGVSNLKTITNFVPNVEVSNSARSSSGGSSYGAWIRGVGNGDYTFPTDPGVGIYVDGVYLARTLGGLLSVADVERLEVLRGPQGTLYGRNTMGGAVNVITTTPNTAGPAEGMTMARYGSYGRKDVVASLNTPIIEGKTGLKLSASYLSSDGYSDRLLTGEELNNEKRWVFRAGLLTFLTDDLTLDVRGDYSTQRNKGSAMQMSGALGATFPANVVRFNTFAAPVQNAQYGLPAGSIFDGRWAPTDPYDTNSLSPVRDNYDIGGGSATLEWRSSETFAIKSITAYRTLETDIRTDGDSSPYSISSINEQIEDDQFSQELQFSGDLFGDRLHYLFGAYYFNEKGEGTKVSESFHGIYQVTGLNADARDTLTFQDYEAESIAAFTQEELKLGGGVSLILGARFNHDRKDYGVEVLLPERGNVVQVPSQTREAQWDSFTPKAGVNWQINDDALLYTSFSTGFKSGGFSNPTATMPAPVYDPEKLRTFELGAKTQWFDRALTLNLTGFHSRWSDIQLTVQVPGPTGGVVNLTANGGTAELYGFESELQARPFSSFVFNINAGYTHNEFTSLAPGAITAGIKYSTKLPHVPEWTLSSGMQYTLDAPIGEVVFRTDYSYRTSQFMNIADLTSRQEGYGLLSARVGYIPSGLPQLELAVEGTNLTDEEYFVIQQAAAIIGVGFRLPGDPRMLAATATYRF